MRLSSRVSWSTCIADGKRLISTNKKGKPRNNDKRSVEYKILKERRNVDYIKAMIENGLL